MCDHLAAQVADAQQSSGYDWLSDPGPWYIQVWLTARTKCTHFILGDDPQLGTISTSVKVSILYL